MDTLNFKKQMAAILLAAGFIISGPALQLAQSQTGKKDASGKSNVSSQSQTSRDNQSGNHVIMENLFIEKASELNLAEVELSKMAAEQASSAKIKQFAQTMIKQHTAAQLELYSIASKRTASMASNAGNDANDETNIESTNNDADKTATLGGTGGTTGSSMAMGKTNGVYNSNRDGSTAKTGTATDSASTTATASNTGTANQASQATGSSAMANEFISTKLSEEHAMIKKKLSTLSGAEFDHLYIQAMENDHVAAIELFEKQALEANDEALQSYASKTLPKLKEHLKQVQQLHE